LFIFLGLILGYLGWLMRSKQPTPNMTILNTRYNNNALFALRAFGFLITHLII
jgi:hypothetical protein